MIRYFFALITSYFLVSPNSEAQVFGDDPKEVKRGETVSNNKISLPPLTIDFQSNHDYYLMIDGKSYGKLSKASSRPIKLPIGTHKLFLESAETGEVIKPTFYITRDMIRRRNLPYNAVFLDSLNIKYTGVAGSPQ